MPTNRRKYDEAFKQRAVRMSYSSERPVTEVAKSLGITTNMIYLWRKKYTPEGDKTKLAQQQQTTLENRVVSIFEEGEGTYGVDRICGILRRDGESASYQVIQRMMHQKGLKSCYRVRRQRSLTDSRKARGDDYKNLTKHLVIDTPFQVISSEFSYIRTGEGFDYLCQIRDVFTNTVLASSQAENMKKELVFQTLRAAQDRWHCRQMLSFTAIAGASTQLMR